MALDGLILAPTIRLATIDDRDTLVAVHAAARDQAYAGHLPDALLHQYSLDDRRAFWLRRLASDDPNAMTWVATVDGELAGFCHAGSPRSVATGNALHVHSLYIAPAFQRLGLGGTLLDRTTATIAAAGFPKATLHVFGFNERAIRFYERRGWDRTAVIEMNRWDDRPIMGYGYEKRLVPTAPGTD